MSQASRSHALAARRRLRSAIKFIARVDPEFRDAFATQSRSRIKSMHGLIGYDVPFNVAKVRAKAEMARLYGKHAHRVKRRHDVDARGRHRWASPVGDWADEAPGEPWPYMDGDDLALVRVAEAVLRAIDGQPSECQRCDGGQLRGDYRQNMIDAMADALNGDGPTEITVTGDNRDGVAVACPTCRGTGHNLRGDLGLIDVSPQLLRRMTEGEGGYYADTMAPWLTSVAAMANDEAQALELIGPAGADPRTRVVARGEHRHHGAVPDAWQAWTDADPGSEKREAALDLLISERRWDVWGDDGRPYAAEPRWFLGEMATLARRTLRIAWRDVRPVVFDLMSEVTEPMETGR